MEQVVSSYQAISHRRETSCILSLPVYPITHEIVKISPTEFQNLHAGTHLVCLTPGAAVSWPASTTGCPGGRGSFRRVHRAAGGDRAAAVATGHRSVVRSGTPRPRVGPSTRLRVQVPFVDATWMSPAPPEALQPRETARYAQRKCEPGKRPKTKKAG